MAEEKVTRKRLYRSESDRMIAGVCGGIGEYINFDPSIIRIIWIFASLFGAGTGIVLYLILWVVIPSESKVNK